MYNQDLLDKVEEIYMGQCESPTERNVVLHGKPWCVTMFNGRKTKFAHRRLLSWFVSINMTHYGLSDMCQRIEYIPTGELLYEAEP